MATVNLLQVVFLAVIQGVTEWLPISSSGHLVIVQEVLDIEVPVFFDILLHTGTLGVILIFFRGKLQEMVSALLRLDFHSSSGRLAVYIAIGNLPTAIVGYTLYDLLISLFSSLLAVGPALIMTGTLLFLCKYTHPRRRLGYVDALLMGVAQAVSIIPGVSRSGFTLGTGLLRGVTREAAFTYSFLMAIPAILGAILFDVRNLSTYTLPPSLMTLGFLVAFVTGYFSLKILFHIITTGRFHWFALYCWTVGALLTLAVSL